MFEVRLQRILVRIWKGFRRVSTHMAGIWNAALLRTHQCSVFNISRDPAVHITSHGSLRTAARAIIGFGIVVLLLVPIVICNVIQKPMVRLGVVAVAATLFVAILCWVVRAKPIQMFVAGAT